MRDGPSQHLQPTQHLQPNFSRTLRRAQRAQEQGESGKAEGLYTELLRQRSDDFDALHGLGQINYRRGRLDAALALIQAALKSDISRADGFASLGLVFHALGQFQRALISYDEGLRLEPNNAELLNRRGVALLELNRPREALAMGMPLFLLLPFAADFRWLRERADSPWYPAARLFRQRNLAIGTVS